MAGTKKKTNKRFRPVDGARISARDAQVLGECVERIKLRAPSGTVTAEHLIEEARRDRAIRHLFEWDDAKAAHEHRLTRARELLRSFEVVITREHREVRVRAMHFLPSQKGYVPYERVFRDTDLTAELIEHARRDAIGWLHRWRHLSEIAGDDLSQVFKSIEALTRRTPVEAAG